MSLGKALEVRWKAINKELSEMGCPIGIPKIRPYQDGANEITKILEVYRKSEPFFFTVTFEFRKSFTGETGRWIMNLSSGMIVIPVIDGKLFFRRQHRPTTGKWTLEFPRVFTNLLADPREVEENSLGIVSKVLKLEVGEVFEDMPKVSAVRLIDEIPEDTGRCVGANAVYVVNINGELKKDDKTYKLFSLEEARKTACDGHTMSALLALMNKMEFEGFNLSV